MGAGQFRQLWLDCHPREGNLIQQRGRKARHGHPSVALRQQRALGRQASDRFAHGRHANTQIIDQPLDRHGLTGLQRTVKDHVAQPRIGDLMGRYLAVSSSHAVTSLIKRVYDAYFATIKVLLANWPIGTSPKRHPFTLAQILHRG